jgi:DNA-binding response OmpR family regulator
MASPGKYLMVVEDDCNLAPFLEAFLRDEGYEVQCCVRSDQVLDEVRHRAPDLIIVEMQRPGSERSHRAIEGLANDPSTASISVIALATVASVLRQVEQYPNVKARILEPFDLEDLLSHIRRLSNGDASTPP